MRFMQTIIIKVTSNENKRALQILLYIPSLTIFISAIISNQYLIIKSCSTLKFYQRYKPEAFLENEQVDNAVENLLGSFVAARNLHLISATKESCCLLTIKAWKNKWNCLVDLLSKRGWYTKMSRSISNSPFIITAFISQKV